MSRRSLASPAGQSPRRVIADELPFGGCLDHADLAAFSDARYRFCLKGATHSSTVLGHCDRLFQKLRARYLKECLLSRGLFPNRGGNGPGGGNSSSSHASENLRSLVDQALAPTWLGADGTGQTIGLLEFDSFNPNDITDYLAYVGLPATEINRLSQVHVNGGAVPRAGRGRSSHGYHRGNDQCPRRKGRCL